MKKNIKFALFAALAIVAVFSMSAPAHAQVSTAPVCPAGYTCTIAQVDCPAGFTCTPIQTDPNCPLGYTCTQTGTQTASLLKLNSPAAGAIVPTSGLYTIKWSVTSDIVAANPSVDIVLVGFVRDGCDPFGCGVGPINNTFADAVLKMLGIKSAEAQTAVVPTQVAPQLTIARGVTLSQGSYVWNVPANIQSQVSSMNSKYKIFFMKTGTSQVIYPYTDNVFMFATPTGTGPTPCYVFTKNLQIGSTGAEVVALQTWLIAHGFDIPNISSGQVAKGSYGGNTAGAVGKYQKSVGILATGIFNPATRESVNASCKPDATGTASISNTSATLGARTIAGGSGIYSYPVSFNFTVNNPTSNPIYLSTSVTNLGALDKNASIYFAAKGYVVPVKGSLIAQAQASGNGDSPYYFFIAPGASRAFAYMGTVDGSQCPGGCTGYQTTYIAGINYGTSPSNLGAYSFSAASIANLKLTADYGGGTPQSSINVVLANGNGNYQLQADGTANIPFSWTSASPNAYPYAYLLSSSQDNSNPAGGAYSSVYLSGSTNSTSGTGGIFSNKLRTINSGQYKVVVCDQSTDIKNPTCGASPMFTIGAVVPCVTGYSWNGTSCVPPVTPPSCPANQVMTGNSCMDYSAKQSAVRNLYLTLQCREPDQQGWDYWTNNSSDLGTIQQQMTWGIEYQTKQQIIQIFQQALRRAPSCATNGGVSELHSWYEKAYANGYANLDVVRNGIGGTVPSIQLPSLNISPTLASSGQKVTFNYTIPTNATTMKLMLACPTGVSMPYGSGGNENCNTPMTWSPSFPTASYITAINNTTSQQRVSATLSVTYPDGSSGGSVGYLDIQPGNVTTSCPAGYICTPPGGTTACPAGYVCVPVTTNCPPGYTCYTSSPVQQQAPTVSNGSATSIPLVRPDGVHLVNATFTFTVNNNSTAPIYIANTRVATQISASSGLSAMITTASASPGSVTGDTANAFFVAPAASRTFTYSGYMDNTYGTPGVKTLSMIGIYYGTNSSTLNSSSITSGLSGLTVTASMDGAAGGVGQTVNQNSLTASIWDAINQYYASGGN